MAEQKEDGHLIGELLAAPIRAIQEAQIAAEREFIQFFVDYGLEEVVRRQGRKRITVLRVRNVEFEMRRSVPNPIDPGTVVERTAVVSTPLLAMINLPSIAIEEATINLSLDVAAETSVARQTTRAAASPRAAVLPPPQARQAPVQLRGNIGTQSLARSLQAKGRLEVSLKLVASRDQEALNRLTALVNDSLSARLGESETL